MELRVGNLIDETLVRKLLRVVPTRDLVNLDAITVRLRPEETRYRYGCGRYIHHDGCKIWIYMWAIQNVVRRNFNAQNSQLFRNMWLEFAAALFHEIGHHNDFLYGNMIDNETKLMNFYQKFGRNPSLVLGEKITRINAAMEQHADDYSRLLMQTALKKNLLNTPRFSECPFFKVMRDRIIQQNLAILRQRGFQTGFRSQILGTLHVLRKAKLTKEYDVSVEYSLTELYHEVLRRVGENPTILRQVGNRQKFSKQIRRIVKPYQYKSRSGRQYSYFSEEQLQLILETLL